MRTGSPHENPAENGAALADSRSYPVEDLRIQLERYAEDISVLLLKNMKTGRMDYADSQGAGERMEWFFYPAITLMNRLSYTSKFALLWLMSLIAIAVVTYSLFTQLNQELSVLQRQKKGVEKIKPVLQSIQLLQQHRALSSAFLGGSDASWMSLSSREEKLAGMFKVLDKDINLYTGSSLRDNYRQIKADWGSLLKKGLRLSHKENFSAHTLLIARMRILMANIYDEYAITTRNEVGMVYLLDASLEKLPDIIEHLGQLRGYGVGILASKQITRQQKAEMEVVIVELNKLVEEFRVDFEKISFINSKDSKDRIFEVSENITQSALRLVVLVRSDILSMNTGMTSEDFFFISTAMIDNAYNKINDLLLPEVSTLIDIRISHAKKLLYLNIGIASLLFVIVIYLSIGIYYSIIGNIRAIARSASAFAKGNLNRRLKLDTRDELGQVGESFNEMAEGFSALLESQKASEEVIWRQANFDQLTGLPNRRLFLDRLDLEIKKANRANLKMALLFLDLDKFKEVNDTLGHNMGDILLVEAAQRIVGCVRDTDTVARLGGDEFTIILAELGDIVSIERVTENILLKLAEPFNLDGNSVSISGSIGIALYPDDATGMESLLKKADQAMYVAKNVGRNRLGYFNPDQQRAEMDRLQLQNDLRGALAVGQFEIHYQPIVELATGNIHKAEALIRWQHPGHGLVSPAQFIPLAEETGLIVEIGDWVFREAAQQAKRWRALCNPMFQISVNKSPVQFRHSGRRDLWPDYLAELGLPGQSIVVEITEGLLLDKEDSVIGRLLEFGGSGIQVAIDDFGTGYSSLSYIKKFNIDYLKIDQSFIRNLASGSSDMALCEAIIVMAHKLGLKVIAEGVETEEQRELLAGMGCDYGQGYLFSRPVPAEELEALLNQNCESLPACNMAARAA